MIDRDSERFSVPCLQISRFRKVEILCVPFFGSPNRCRSGGITEVPANELDHQTQNLAVLMTKCGPYNIYAVGLKTPD